MNAPVYSVQCDVGGGTPSRSPEHEVMQKQIPVYTGIVCVQSGHSSQGEKENGD